MARVRRNRSGVATRRRILDVATTMFAAAGYEATSLRQIAGAADIDLATLKYHFGDKETLFSEVYREGHGELLRYVEPVLGQMAAVQEPGEVEGVALELVRNFHDFIEDHQAFTRMVLYRMLEDPSNMSELEHELQGIAVTMFEKAFERLADKGVVRRVDTRALIAFVALSMPMWFVTCEVKPEWLGEPNPVMSQEGRERSERFFSELIGRFLRVD